jgi:hypothetical protein
MPRPVRKRYGASRTPAPAPPEIPAPKPPPHDLIRVRCSPQVRTGTPPPRPASAHPFSRPDREHHRQSGPPHPLRPQIEREPRQLFRLDPQRRIADNQRCVVFRQHLVQVRAPGATSSGRHPYRSRQQDPRQRHRRPRTRIGRQRPDLPNGSFEISRMLRTGPSQAIPRSGRKSEPSRSSSAHGTSPISASPQPSASAHCAGRSKRKSNNPSEPCKNPQTRAVQKLTAPTHYLNGQVFR